MLSSVDEPPVSSQRAGFAGPDTIWSRVAAREGGRPALSYDRIAVAALRLADDGGLPAVTLRALAGELGVTPMALYRYVDTKDDLLALMVDAAFGHPQEPSGGGWRELMRWYAQVQRQVILDHPWLVHVPPRARTGLTPRIAALIDRALASLRDEKLSNDQALAVVDTVAAYAHGAATPEAAQRALAAELGLDSLTDVRAAIAGDVQSLLATGQFPTLASRLVDRGRSDDMDWRFELGLDCVLDGLGSRLGLDPPNRRRAGQGN